MFNVQCSMFNKSKIFAIILLLLCTKAKSDEGMWMLNKIDEKTAQAMKELGLQLTPRELYNPDGVSLKDAVVDFGDFCSGVVVSPNGLVFTNHHCGYGAMPMALWLIPMLRSVPQKDSLCVSCNVLKSVAPVLCRHLTVSTVPTQQLNLAYWTRTILTVSAMP